MNIRIDIDDTICYYLDNKLDYHKAIPDYDKIKIVNELYDSGNYIVFWSSRGVKTKIDWYNLTKKTVRRMGC